MVGTGGPSSGGLLRGGANKGTAVADTEVVAQSQPVKLPRASAASVSTVQELLVLLNWLISFLDNKRKKTLAGVLNKEVGEDEAARDLSLFQQVKEALEKGDAQESAFLETDERAVAGIGEGVRPGALPKVSPAGGAPLKPPATSSAASANPEGASSAAQSAPPKVSFTKSGPIFRRS